MSSKVKIGVVAYKNARPLIHTIWGTSSAFSLYYHVPSQLARDLQRNNYHIILGPSLEYLQSPDYRVIPGVSISSDGPVVSVKVFSKKKPEDIKRVAVTNHSVTSVALMRILLKRVYGCEPEMVDIDPKLETMRNDCDASLLIGDSALEFDEAGYHTLDLGEAWKELTNKPFVYALWLTTKNAQLQGIDDILREAKEQGVQRIDEIVEDELEGNPDADAEALRIYLTENIHYDLGEPELEGLRMFFQMAHEEGLAPEPRPIQFFDE